MDINKNHSNINNLSDRDFFQLALETYKISEQGERRRFKYRISNIDVARFHKASGHFKNKKILSVSGSAMQLLDLLSYENDLPKYIYGFDYSPKQVAYNYLLKYAIEYLAFDDFCDFFGIRKKNVRRTIKNKKIRLLLIKKIPYALRKYLPYSHEMTNRDLLLKLMVNIPFLKERKQYDVVKENIGRIRFFVYNLNTSFNARLSFLFCSNFFNFVYLSNALDWIYWHNQDGTFSMDEIIDNVARVSSPRSMLLLDHLASRKTSLTSYLEKKDILKIDNYRTYKYYWQTYKLLINK